MPCLIGNRLEHHVCAYAHVSLFGACIGFTTLIFIAPDFVV